MYVYWFETIMYVQYILFMYYYYAVQWPSKKLMWLCCDYSLYYAVVTICIMLWLLVIMAILWLYLHINTGLEINLYFFVI